MTRSAWSTRSDGNFVKWLIVGILGLALGTVMFGESVAKILAWLGGDHLSDSYMVEIGLNRMA